MATQIQNELLENYMSRKWFDMLKPDPSLIDLQGIAGALSKLGRFGDTGLANKESQNVRQ